MTLFYPTALAYFPYRKGLQLNFYSDVLLELPRNGYGLLQKPAVDQREGGIAIVHRNQINIKHKTSDMCVTRFEHLECSYNAMAITGDLYFHVDNQNDG